MKTSVIIALSLATLLSGSLAATAQTEPPTVHHHYHHYYPPHRAVHHHYVSAPAVGPGPATVVTAPAPQAAPFGLSLPHIAPYPDGRGDEDGLSDDFDNCNKGCVGGAPN